VPGKCIFIIGGARSGKSRLAEEMAASLDDQVLYVATAAAGDGEMRARIAAHRARRPAQWRTLEIETNVAAGLKRDGGSGMVIIIDCLTLLVSNIMGVAGEIDFAGEADKEINELMSYINESTGTFIIVSSEVGLGLVPEYPSARQYRDVLGRANEQVAAAAAEVYLMVAGLRLRLK
jgi:adenosylcobinamide kinase / adenosylcobinamide-phosphate guanylyltransferase